MNLLVYSTVFIKLLYTDNAEGQIILFEVLLEKTENHGILHYNYTWQAEPLIKNDRQSNRSTT
jgi:hypothetical protein